MATRSATVYAFLPIQPSPIPLAECLGGRGETGLGGPTLATYDMVLGHPATLGRHSMGTPSVGRLTVSITGSPVPPFSSGTKAVSLAFERTELLAMGLSQAVVQAVQGDSTINPSSSCSQVESLWGMVQETSSGPSHLLSPRDSSFFARTLGCRKVSPSTLRGMVAAIKAARMGRYQLSEGVSNLVTRFLKAAGRRIGTRLQSPLLPLGFRVGFQGHGEGSV